MSDEMGGDSYEYRTDMERWADETSRPEGWDEIEGDDLDNEPPDIDGDFGYDPYAGGPEMDDREDWPEHEYGGDDPDLGWY